MSTQEVKQTIIVGGGQAGLAAGYYLAQNQIPFLILDGSHRTGDIWRKRWDSLRLFTPSYFNQLPGMQFPRPDHYFPTKDEVADWLEEYSNHFNLPIEHGANVSGVRRVDAHYEVGVEGRTIEAKNVIIATGAFHTPRVPDFSGDLDPAVTQMHSADYRNPAQIKTGSVLVVGAGNSGAEIGLELAKTGKNVTLAGRDVGSIPADKFGKFLGGRPYWWFLNHVLTVRTPVGRKMKASVTHQGNPLIRTQRMDLTNLGVKLIGRIKGVKDGKPLSVTDSSLEEGTVIWATGYKPDFKWIELPVFDEFGYPRHKLGVVPEAPGLYFVGLHFQSGLASALLGGVGSDARYITQQLKAR